MAVLKVFDKDPDARLDYTIDWADWLDGDEIAQSEWLIPDGMTSDEDLHTASTTTVWLSGGTLNERYDVTCRITTNLGRIDDRTIRVRIRSK